MSAVCLKEYSNVVLLAQCRCTCRCTCFVQWFRPHCKLFSSQFSASLTLPRLWRAVLRRNPFAGFCSRCCSSPRRDLLVTCARGWRKPQLLLCFGPLRRNMLASLQCSLARQHEPSINNGLLMKPSNSVSGRFFASAHRKCWEKVLLGSRCTGF